MRSAWTTLLFVMGLLVVQVGSADAYTNRALDVNSCGLDEFAGAELDGSRWEVLRPGTAGTLTVADGRLRLQALRGDLYGDRDTAQNVVLQSAPTGAWTATTQLDTAGLTAEGQQSGIVVRKSATTFSKFVFINKGGGNRRFEHIYTENQTGRLSDADFTATLPAGFPAVVKLRVISDGQTIRGEYADGDVWKPIGRPAKIGGGVDVGVYAADNEVDGPVVPYDFFSLNAQDDEFAGDALESCRWSSIVRAEPAGYRVAGGALEIDTGAGEVNTTAPNLIGQPVPGGDWEAETKVDLTTTAQGQQAGLLLYRDNANWIKAVLVRTGTDTAQIEFVRVKDNGYQLDPPFKVDVPTSLTSFQLRLRASGTQATAQYSTDGTTWTDVGKARDIADLAPGQLGPMALRGGASQSATARFDYVRVRPSEAVAAVDLFTTIGITRSETRQNSGINGNPPYSLPGEEMPPSRTVGVAPDDGADDVPLRMPDTTGNVPNLAEFRGQTLTLLPNDQKAYDRLHFFGTTADGSGGGEFTLAYEGGVERKVDIRFPDWCGSPTETAHRAIGPLSKRWRAEGQDGAPCSIYHYPIDNPEPERKLLSITLPPSTAGGGEDTRAYLMALTLEDGEGNFELPDLSGRNEFPDDGDAPASQVAVDPPAPSGEQGWYATPPLVTITSADEDGGSGVEQVQYRVNGGTPQFYTAPFRLTAEGELTLEYRAIDRAGNAETFKAIELKVDAGAPTTTASSYPGDVIDGGWHDREVTVGLRADDGGSGVARTEYRVNAGDWLPYTAPFTVADAGDNVVEYRSADVAGNVENARSLSVRVDVTAPVTAVRLNGGAPAALYTGAVRVAFTRDDGAGSGAVATEYRVDDGDWTPYDGAFDVVGNSGHRVDFRSTDAAGNVENFKTVIFTIRPPVQLPAPVQQAQPAPAPKPFAGIEDVAPRLRTLSALRGGRLAVGVSCQGVSRGTLTLSVDRAVVRKLKLKTGTLARKVLRCGEEGRATVSLKPSAAVRKALARSKTSVKAKLTLRMTGAATDTQTVTFRGKS